MVCPILFETNCKNRDGRCFECLAATGVGKLYYSPLVRLKQEHPCKDLTAVARGKECNKRGRKVEANLVKDFGLVATEASGAKFRDGDGRLLLPDGDDIKISIKSRTGKNKLAITPDEFLIDQIHLINSKEYGTVVIMSKLVFDQLEQGYIRHEQKSQKEDLAN